MRTCSLVFVFFLGLGPPLSAQERTYPPPRLGVATNFGQGWQPDMFAAAQRLAVRDFRDAVYWRDVEGRGGTYDFSGRRRSWPDLLPETGAGMSLTVNNGHPAWDGGHTPHTRGAMAAFARFAAAAAARFPAIHTVEIGNEMNSDTFVSGPGWDGDLRTRAQSYTALLAETAMAVRAVRPDVRILGGAAHSIPLAWFQALFDAGAAQHMDALAIHPYGVAPEQLRRQIGQLRRLPQAADIPIEVTEFGHTDPARAPAYLLKSYCQMALSGVDRVIWYPLNPRGDGLVPLVGTDGAPTDVGRAYRFVSDTLSQGPVSDAAPDPFTYGCRFGSDRMVIWGEPRRIMPAPQVRAFDATGAPVSPDGLTISMDRPLILIAVAGSNSGTDAGTDIAQAVTLAPQTLIADSVHQFSYTGDGDPFQRLVVKGRSERQLEPRPGQEKNGVPWVPYLGTRWDGVLRAGADWVLPSHPSAGPLDVVYRYTAETALHTTLTLSVAPSGRSVDGIVLTVAAGGQPVLTRHVTDAQQIGPLPVTLNAGDTLEVRIAPGPTARGDVTRLRVTLHAP